MYTVDRSAGSVFALSCYSRNLKFLVKKDLTCIEPFLQGHIGAYVIIGGVDVTGPHIYTIAAHGSSCKVFFPLSLHEMHTLTTLKTA
jgi:hypothetical protein